MNNDPQYEVLKEFGDDNELTRVLQTGSYDDKRHALLNIAYSDRDGEAALDIFLAYVQDPQLKFTAYLCIDMFLETSRSYPLLKLLPVLISGLDSEDEFIASHCESALENLVRPAKIANEDISFSSFCIDFDKSSLSDYLNSHDTQQNIIALLYLFHHPHVDQDLFQILNEQVTKDNKAVTCIVGQIIDTKLWSIIEQINGLEEISLALYRKAIASKLSRAKWIYDRFDEIQYLAKDQMDRLGPQEANE